MRLARQISLDETARSLLAALGRDDLSKLQTRGGYSVEGLQQLDQDRALNALKTQLMDTAGAAPSAGQLRVCLRMLASSQPQEPKNQAVLGHEYHRYRNEFVLVPAIPASRQDVSGWPFGHAPVDLGGAVLASDWHLGGIDAGLSGCVWALGEHGQKCLKGHNKRILPSSGSEGATLGQTKVAAADAQWRGGRNPRTAGVGFKASGGRRILSGQK